MKATPRTTVHTISIISMMERNLIKEVTNDDTIIYEYDNANRLKQKYKE